MFKPALLSSYWIHLLQMPYPFFEIILWILGLNSFLQHLHGYSGFLYLYLSSFVNSFFGGFNSKQKLHFLEAQLSWLVFLYWTLLHSHWNKYFLFFSSYFVDLFGLNFDAYSRNLYNRFYNHHKLTLIYPIPPPQEVCQWYLTIEDH